MNPDVDMAVVEIGSPETPLAILFQRSTDADGDDAYNILVRGRMDPQELISALRSLADHIEDEQNGDTE